MKLSDLYPEFSSKGLIVQFTDDELTAITDEIVSVSQRVKAQIERAERGINRTRRDLSKSQEEAWWIGLAGEYAVAKTFGLAIKDCDTTKIGVTRNTGHDLTLPGWLATTVQVKTKLLRIVSALNTQRWDFVLDGVDRSEFAADYGILSFVYPCRTQVNLAGYITREEFISMNTTIDLGTGLRACVPLSRMHPVEDLVTLVNGCKGGRQ